MCNENVYENITWCIRLWLSYQYPEVPNNVNNHVPYMGVCDKI